MLSLKKNVLIIGAGIHGITIALELSKKYNVTIVDANKEILWETSKNNHNRIHLGYHYPRSRDTIQECKLGYEYFTKNYKDCLVFPDFFYVICKKSKTSSRKFKSIMKAEKLECRSSWPKEMFLNRAKIDDSFKVREACIDINKFRKKIIKELYDRNIALLLNFKIENVKWVNGMLLLNSENDKKLLSVDKIINCTYTNANNILKLFHIKDRLTKYIFEETEVAVVKSNVEIPALTVMDGPYISILPHAGHDRHYLVYDVKNSVVRRTTGTIFTRSKKYKSNWKQMLKHGLQYYPFFNNLKYKYSLYANRPIPSSARGDSRATRIIKQHYKIDFFTVREGKLISAPYIAAIFAKRLCGE